MTQHIIADAADAERVREALGRLYAESQNAEYPIPGNPPIPETETRYYVDPRVNADETQVAFGPLDAFLETTLGKTVTLGDSSTVNVPTTVEDIDASWFKPPNPPRAQ